MSIFILALCVIIALVGFNELVQNSAPKFSFAFATTNNGAGRTRKLNIDATLARVLRMGAPTQNAAPATSLAPVFHAIDHVLDVVVINRRGYPTGEKRAIANTVWGEFFADKPIVMIDWLLNGSEDEPTADDLAKPITFMGDEPVGYKGLAFFGCYGWGSAIKRGFTIGMTEDLLRTTGMAHKSEDGQRAGRAYTPNAMYGAGRGTTRIYIAKKGELIAGRHPVDDGFGYASTSYVAIMRNKTTGIQLGQVRDNFHMTQRLAWSPELAKETLPHIAIAINDLTDGTKLIRSNRVKMDDKETLVSLDAQMLLHPFVANHLNQKSQEYAVRAATSIPMAGKYRVAVPTTVPYDTVNRLGGIASLLKAIIGRYPMDSNNSETAVQPIPADHDLVVSEIARIAAMAVIQYTLYCHKFFAKGQVGMLTDAEMIIRGNQYDLVLCEEDIKMAVIGVTKTRQLQQITIDAYFGMTMYYQPGNAVGVNPELWKHMGGDFDGDGIIIVNCAFRPALWDTCRALLPGMSDKLNKTNTDFETSGDKRIDMILKSRICAKIVGYATNVMATTFAVKNRKALAYELGKTLGNQESKLDLDWWLNFWVKVGTDGFKTDVNVDQAYKALSIVQGQLSDLLGGGAPWCGWHKDPMVFKHTVPVFYFEKDATHERGMTKEEARTCVPATMDGTVVDILRITLPQMHEFLTIGIDAKPLSHFKYWALRVSDELNESAIGIQRKYGGRASATNWTDPDSIDQFKVWYRTVLVEYDDLWQKYTRLERASAIWQVAHSSQAAHNGAGAIFQAEMYKEEVHQIITDKPGLRQQNNSDANTVILVGLANVLDASLQGEIKGEPMIRCDVIVDEFTTHDRKDARKTTIRKIVRASVNGQTANLGGYPIDTLGTVVMGGGQPDSGIYCAVITRESDKSWKCQLAKKEIVV